MRTQVPPQSLSSAIQDQLRQSTGLPVSDVESMDDIVSVSVSRQKFNMWVMSVFGGCALLLAAIGIYGLMAYSVEQRTQEIGIRLALGAQASQVKNMVVGQGMGLALVGVVIGLGACVLAGASDHGVPVRRDGARSVRVRRRAGAARGRRASSRSGCRRGAPASVDPIIALRYE